MRRFLHLGIRAFAAGTLIVVICAAASAQESDLLDDILSQKEVRVATYLQYKPFMFKNENGVPQGFDIDMPKKLAEAMGGGLFTIDGGLTA